MRKLIYLILLGFFVSVTFAQSKLSKQHSKTNLDCSVCHVCEVPTKINPCLASCPRKNNTTAIHKLTDAPKVFEINNVNGEKDIYSAVTFSHKAHAEMSEMSGGCETCHHYNPPGKIVKCSTCHEAERKNVDVNMPDLKSAYHRECMDCHAEWEEESHCENCHTLNDTYKTSTLANTIVKMHEPVTRPVTKVYKTDKCKKGKVATFHHNDHINLFGLECANCHKDESCQSCHNQKPNFTKSVNGINHSRCENCHDTENTKQCIKCHSEKETKPFNHFANTNFDINKYHSKNSCQSCHKKEGKYSGLKSNCENCHNWNSDNFKHTITGLQLSEDHIDNECSDCHVDNNYSNPTCDNCHDEDEGFVVPKKLPGKRIK
jgi:hypothetical protein